MPQIKIKPTHWAKWCHEHRFMLFYMSFAGIYGLARLIHWEFQHWDILTYPSVEVLLFHFIEEN